MKKDWEIKKLGEVGTFIRGGNFSKKDFVEKGFPCIHYGQIHMKFGIETLEHISSVPSEMVKPDRCAKKGDLVIAITSEDDAGSCKCTAWMGDYDAYVGNHAAIYRHAMQPKFVSYYFNSPQFQKAKLEFTHGFKVVEINPKDIAKIAIPVPPLEEQKRIVKILDEKFAQLESLKANAQTNLQNAKDLFQSEFVNIFNKANTVRMITVETVCSSIVDCPHSTPKWITNGKLCLRTTNFKPNQIDLSTKYYVSDETYNERVLRLKPQPGDIVFSREGGILGIACMIPNGIYPCLGQRMMLLRPRKETDNRFLMYYLNSPMIEKIIKSKILGAAAPHINVADVKSFPIPEFPLSEQKRIVKELDTLSEKVRQLQEIYTKQIANCDELKQAYLQKAFEGEL